jgi:hypothetical protein
MVLKKQHYPHTNKATSTRRWYFNKHNNRDLSNDVDQKLFNASAFYTKKLKKKGRTISVNVHLLLKATQTVLKSDLNFYNTENKLIAAQVR